MTPEASIPCVPTKVHFLINNSLYSKIIIPLIVSLFVDKCKNYEFIKLIDELSP